ncbi:MAG: Lrp/AsnC family transcriptional regulator [Caenispirillum bisanense]|nr:Lrp/AsnC family transcriptional regulator [Caenispirillum bisanense]MCA1973174.1 Lrp/AsnC family transcriptional regulator [Caenispirillum sp.]
MKLDALDLKILCALQEDGRITKLKLAERVALSPSACFERMRRLEQAGFVTGYHADLDLAKLVRVSFVFVEVTLKTHRSSDFQRFEAHVQEVPEILECYAIGGGVDYMLKVVATDIAHYQAVIDALLDAEVGVDRYFTYIVTKPVKRRLDYPVRELLRRG